MKPVTILDYGMCNLLNVARAFEYIGAELTVTEDVKVAANAERLVVPGVGAFEDSVREVRFRGFDETIGRFIATGRPFLGICVGMQMLFDESEEFGSHKGLGLLPGAVKAVPNHAVDGSAQRVPHIGWNALVEPATGRTWEHTLFEGIATGDSAAYFVHSFVAVPAQPTDRLADCVYGGHRLCAAVQRDNIMATQFHPERSGKMGLNLLRRFTQI